MQDTFADIRPYQDDEVVSVLSRVCASDTVHVALLKYRFPWAPVWLRRCLSPLVGRVLEKQIGGIRTVQAFQVWMGQWVERLLDRTTIRVDVRGLDSMAPEQGHLWISNHRDIAMDPTLINYALHKAGWPTSRIAIGDNLLSHPDVADVMRLNKSFIVKRNIANKREKLTALQQLSNYIRHSLDECESVWIAQREGRAKNAIDVTDTAVLKMLALHGRERSESFTEAMSALRPVPVCIQYEWDPCDIMKARELVARERYGSYSKQDGEDTRSLLTGITGKKGVIHVDFGRPLTSEEMATPERMANAIDEQIRAMTEILPIHYSALTLLQQLFGDYPELEQPVSDRQLEESLRQRVEGEDRDVQRQVLKSYAMPILLSQGAVHP